jgi:hypothetical protein
MVDLSWKTFENCNKNLHGYDAIKFIIRILIYKKDFLNKMEGQL